MNENIFRLFCFIFYSILFCSCKFSVDEPVKDYLEYWSSTCHVAEVQYGSPFVSIGGLSNFPTTNEVEINLITVNPKGYRLLCGPGGSCFSFSNDSGDLEYADYSETLADTSMIKVRAKFSDEFEGQTITLSGCLWPENKVAFSEGDLRAMNPELFYSTQFVLNTPPDKVGNLRNPVEAEVDSYHCVHFYYPDQSLNKHQNLHYVVDLYLSEGGSFRHIASRSLIAADSKSSSPTEFVYYFAEQVPSLQYDYVVTAYNASGLHSETVATNPALGVSYVTEPIFSLTGGIYNDMQAEQDGASFDVYEYKTTPNLTVTNTADGATLQVSVNGVAGGTSQTLSDGFNTVSVRVSKNLCRPITVTKHIYIIKSLTEPTITYSGSKTVNSGSGTSDVLKYSILEQKNIKLSVTNTYTGSGTTMETSIDNGTAVEGNVNGTELSDGNHTIKVTLKREYCKDLEVTRSVSVSIKPVRVQLTGGKIENHYELKGAVYVNGADPLSSWTGSYTSFEDPNFDVKGHSFWLSTRNEEFYFYTSGLRAGRRNSGSHYDPFNPSGRVKLEDLRTRTEVVAAGGSGESYTKLTFYFNLKDD